MKKVILSLVFVVLLMLSLVSCSAFNQPQQENDQVPYIGRNGNWWVGDTDTLVASKAGAV